jgi:hypothetical protein
LISKQTIASQSAPCPVFYPLKLIHELLSVL